MKRSFIENCQLLDATRLSKSAKATIQSSGRLGFSGEAIKLMELKENQTILILKDNDSNDLAAVVVEGEDKRGFFLKRSGTHCYLRMKNYFDQAGIDYKKRRVMFDITQLDETFENKPVFRFSYREIERGSTEDKAEQQNDQPEQQDEEMED